MSKYIVEMNNIVKEFGEVTAISEGQFQLKKGEIHSLIGENGTGKSTMMKLLFGMYPKTSGEIIYKGNKLGDYSTKEAIEMKIGMVHQEFMLIEELTVLENIILGSEPKKGFSIDFNSARKEAQDYIDKYNLNINLDKKVIDIPIGEAQRVEIIKVLSKGADIVILDEPTAVLTPQEAQSLFSIIESMKEDGKTIIFISHKMDEVLQISDRITVMRKGKYVGTIDAADANYGVLSEMMIGREVFLENKKTTKSNKKEKIALKIENIWVPGDSELSKLRDVNLEVFEGEILGVAGIDGNGQFELEQAIAGLREIEKGNIFIGGQDVTKLNPYQTRKAGLTYIPSDRNTVGLNRTMSIEDNLISIHLDKEKYVKNSVLKRKEISDYAKTLIEYFDIRPIDPKTLTSSQSGGNAQKVVVAREVTDTTKILVASQPTRGVDIGAIESIRSILNRTSEAGAGVLLISADLGEILSLSDRIIVIYEGKIVANLSSSEANEENLGMYMMGGHNDYDQEEGEVS